MIISVASGKGGTGKTTVAANLALALDEPLTFLDCDVEEPNAALFLAPKLDQQERVGLLVPRIDAAKCTLCGRCSEVCRYNALAVTPTKVLVFDQLCHGCGSCTLNCGSGYITDPFRAGSQNCRFISSTAYSWPLFSCTFRMRNCFKARFK